MNIKSTQYNYRRLPKREQLITMLGSYHYIIDLSLYSQQVHKSIWISVNFWCKLRHILCNVFHKWHAVDYSILVHPLEYGLDAQEIGLSVLGLFCLMKHKGFPPEMQNQLGKICLVWNCRLLFYSYPCFSKSVWSHWLSPSAILWLGVINMPALYFIIEASRCTHSASKSALRLWSGA